MSRGLGDVYKRQDLDDPEEPELLPEELELLKKLDAEEE